MANKCPTCHFDNPETQRFCGACGTKLDASAPVHPPSPGDRASVTRTLDTTAGELVRGTLFGGRYEIIEELGQGGMGRVYRAQDTKLNEEIALKLIKPEIAAERRVVERFRNELKTARKIRHKNVCGMYDLHEEGKTLYLTMEYVRGEDLKSLIHRTRTLSIGTALLIAHEVAEGVAEAHKLDIIHRDLKPGNIMIDRDGNAKVMDFGIARVRQEKGITGEGAVVGSPEYMSPEQVEGKEADARSDIYALGVILFEMIVGRPPFEGETSFSIANKHRTEPPPIPKKLVPQIPEGLNRLILRCLEKDRAKRYQTAEELLGDLSAVEQALPVTDRVVPRAKTKASHEITIKFTPKKILSPVAVSILVIAIIVILFKFFPPKPPTPAPSGIPSVAVMYFKNNTGDSKFDVWSTALSDSIITDLSQSRYVRVLSTDQLLGVLRKLALLEARSYASEDLKKVAQLGGVKHILVGSMSKAGNAFRIDFTLLDTQKGESIASDRVEGTGENSIFSMVDELTRKVKSNLQLTQEQITSDVETGIARMTTTSPQAYKYLSQGYRYIYQGEYRKSIELLEQAVALDPKFAFAYAALGTAYGSLGYDAKWKEYCRKASELCEHLPDLERYGIQARYYQTSEATYDRAIEASEKRLHIEPNDVLAARILAYIYISLEQWDKALALIQGNITSGAEAISPYSYAATAYSAKGLYDKAKEILTDYRRTHADLGYIRRRLAWASLCQGQLDLASEEADKAFTLAPSDYSTILAQGDIKCLAGDFSGAGKDYLRLLDSAEKPDHLAGRERLELLYLYQWKTRRAVEEAKQGMIVSDELADKERKSDFLRFSGYVHLRLGKPNEALKELNLAKDDAFEIGSINGQINSLYLKGLALLETNSTNEAQAVADGIKKLVEEWLDGKLIRYHYSLLGNIETKKGHYSKAIEYLDKAISFLDYQRNPDTDAHALFYEPLALAYLKSGNLAKAQEQYEKLTQLTTGRLSYGDIYARAFYMLGKIAGQQGNKSRARENYRKFLELWKDADAGLPDVEDARRSLAGLQN